MAPSNAYSGFLLRLVAIAEHPQRLWNNPDKSDVQLMFSVAAGVLLVLVLCLIVATDAKYNAPVPEVEEEDESRNVDYRRMLEEATGGEILSGSTDKYDWQQSDSEVDMFLRLGHIEDVANIRSKEVKVDIGRTALTVTIRGKVELQGDFYAEVTPDDCNWQMDEGEDGTRRLWITLTKRTKTARNSHWTCFLRGDATVDTVKLGPQAVALDTSDPAALKAAVANLRQRVKDKASNAGGKGP